MRLSSIVCGLLLILCPRGWCGESGLVARYSFDEPSGEMASDSSGHGFAGRIVGATRVPSPRGQALRFDGRDDYVDCGMPAGMQLSGDLTIEAWVRPTGLSGRNRLIFGDTAGLSILRNYSLRFDTGGFFYEHGDNQDYTNVFCATLPPLNEWSHVAMVIEYPRYYLYLGGRVLQCGEIGIPPRPTHGAARCIGGWAAGWFQGDIDEVALYNRSLPERAIMAHAGLVPRAHLSVRPALVYTRQRLTGEVVLNGELPPGSSAVSDRAPGWHRGCPPAGTVDRDAARLRALAEQRGLPDARLPRRRAYAAGGLSAAPAGDCWRAGKGGFGYPLRPPAWFRSQAGITGRPHPPFEPATSGYDPCGRRYTPAAGPVFAQIEAPPPSAASRAHAAFGLVTGDRHDQDRLRRLRPLWLDGEARPRPADPRPTRAGDSLPSRG